MGAIGMTVGGFENEDALVSDAFTEARRRTISRIEWLSSGADPDAQIPAVTGSSGAVAIAHAVDDEELCAWILHETRNGWASPFGAIRRRRGASA